MRGMGHVRRSTPGGGGGDARDGTLEPQASGKWRCLPHPATAAAVVHFTRTHEQVGTCERRQAHAR